MSAEAWIGHELDGRYVVEAVLGVGGMGAVFRARHKFTGSQVAVKVLKPDVQLDPAVQSRFLAEAQAPNRIGHPAIVQVVDAGRTAQGSLYMVMELLTGRTLREALARHDLSAMERGRVLRDLLDVLVAAHAKGFVHRDLKPDNVFLSAPSDTVRLLDFGIAKVLDGTRTANTVTGAVLGTPAYMAPEQLEDARSVDARADLWAIGVMAYEMISGRLPLRGRTVAELLTLLATGQVTPIRTYVPDVSPQLEAFFARALAVDPRQRFGSAPEMAAALAGALPAATPRAHPPTPAPLLPAARQHPPTPAPLVPTAASLATPPMAPTAASVAASHHPPGRYPRALTLGKSTRLWIALTISLGALAILVILLVTRKGGHGAVDAGRPADQADATVVVTEPPVDTPEPGPADALLGVRPTPSVDYCRKRCADVEARCKSTLPSCERDCFAPGVVDCIERAMIDCADGAVCGARIICNDPRLTPKGAASCGETFGCQANCRLQQPNVQVAFRCGCNCLGKMASTEILKLAQLNACAARCNAEPICMQQRCLAEIAACQAP